MCYFFLQFKIFLNMKFIEKNINFHNVPCILVIIVSITETIKDNR